MSLSWRPAAISAVPDADAAAVADLVDGAAWARFCASLAATGEQVLRADLPGGDLERATAVRHLLAMLRVGVEQALAAPDPAHPALQPWRTDVYKYGHDCPDALYRSTPVRGDLTYRVRGSVGSVRYLSFQLEGPHGTVGNLRADQMQVGPDGRFEVWFGPEERPGNWLRTTAGTDQLFVRQFFSDWDTEEPATFSIEAFPAADEGPAPHPGRPERVAAQVAALGEWFDAITRYYADREATDRVAWPNAFMPARAKTEAGGAAEIVLGHGHFDLDPGSALLVEVPPPRALYWSLDLTNPWRESLDYAVRQTSLNDSQAVVDDDGVFRAVVAHHDPGVPNWLDTMGHGSGAMVLRWVVADSVPEPRCTVVPHESIRDVLPAGTPVVTPAERAARIAARRRHVLRRFAT